MLPAFSHPVSVLWTQEMIGALLICHCFPRYFFSSIFSPNPKVDKTTFHAPFLQSFPDLPVIRLIEAFSTWPIVFSLSLFPSLSWWLQQLCRWSIPQPVLSQPWPLYLEWCIQPTHLSHLLSELNSRPCHCL